MNTYKTILKATVTMLLYLLLPMQTQAQIGFDIAGTEAFISDHKGERSLLITRSIIEQSNKVLHSTSNDTNASYKNIGEQLDKYTKAFDAIDLIVNTLSTGFQIYETVENVSDKVSKYGNLLSDFHNKIIKRGKIEPVDTILFTINRDAIKEIYSECNNIYSSVTAIAVYSTGQLLAKTSDINIQIQQIDNSLKRIDEIINRAYFHTYTYIKSRIYMWKREIWTAKSKGTIANEAFARWRERGRDTKVTPKEE